MRKKAEAQLFGLLVIIALPFVLLQNAAESVGVGTLLILLLLAIGFLIFYQKKKARKRREFLLQKYNNSEIVEDIMKHRFWQGQTSEQLLDSLGKPVDIDEKVLKTKIKEVWKYNRRGKNRYGLRITLENRYVVGWDNK